MMTVKHLKHLVLVPLITALAILSGCHPTRSNDDTNSTDNAQDNPVVESGSETPEPATPEPQALQSAAVELSFASIKSLQFDWTDVEGATHYTLMENPDGQSGFSAVVDGIPTGTETVSFEIPLHLKASAEYILQSFNDSVCAHSETLTVLS